MLDADQRRHISSLDYHSQQCCQSIGSADTCAMPLSVLFTYLDFTSYVLSVLTFTRHEISVQSRGGGGGGGGVSKLMVVVVPFIPHVV